MSTYLHRTDKWQHDHTAQQTRQTLFEHVRSGDQWQQTPMG